MSKMTVIVGDLTRQSDLDAIVNAANCYLEAGGGVCGAIHAAAGPDLARECATLDGCDVGDAKATAAYDLANRWVIHAVGPIWEGGGEGEDEDLASAYARSLEVAAEIGAKRIGFPAISTGVFGFPAGRAAGIAVATVAAALSRLPTIEEVRFVCFNEAQAELYRPELARRSP